MAKLNLEYYSGDNRYSDGDIEDEILQIVKSGTPFSQLGKVPFPVLYHLSKVRENILNWYPFQKAASCLEIGSGCGALSGLLCEKMQQVVSVELSKRRADINFARNEACENLEIVVGNLNDMVFPDKFDYIVLNGVFEYAMSFTPGDKPYEDFLSYIMKFLKPGGILLVAIENRLGLKYFAGAPEDHTNAYMDGLKNYPGNDSVRTFSKSEWLDLMEACGLFHHKFYYPYPDYKFPCEIFTDQTLESQKYGRKIWNFTEYRFELFSEREMAATFLKEGMMDRFVNSFLIEMSARPLQPEREVLYAKMNMDRADRFAIMTTIEETDGERQAVKSPLTNAAGPHILGMAKAFAKKEGRYALLKGKVGDGRIRYPYLRTKSLGAEASEAIREYDKERVRALVREVYEHCLLSDAKTVEYRTAAFQEVFGEERLEAPLACICPANIDLILDNIFPDEGKMAIIDGEWIFDFPVPITFIIWRTINEIYSNRPWFESQLSRREWMSEYGMDEQMEVVFWKWATHFEQNYVEANTLAVYSEDEIGISLEEIRSRRFWRTYVNSTLYIDTGAGFSEEQSQKRKTKLVDGKLSLSFFLNETENVKALRFDPLEDHPSVCRLHLEGGKLIPVNAVGKKKGGDLFLTSDPIYRIKWKGKAPDKLSLHGTIEVLEENSGLRKYLQMFSKAKLKNLWRTR